MPRAAGGCVGADVSDVGADFFHYRANNRGHDAADLVGEFEPRRYVAGHNAQADDFVGRVPKEARDLERRSKRRLPPADDVLDVVDDGPVGTDPAVEAGLLTFELKPWLIAMQDDDHDGAR